MNHHPYKGKHFVTAYNFLPTDVGHVISWQCALVLIPHNELVGAAIFFLIAVIIYMTNEEINLIKIEKKFAWNSVFFYTATGILALLIGMSGLEYLIVIFVFLDLFWIFYAYKTYKRIYLSINGSIN